MDDRGQLHVRSLLFGASPDQDLCSVVNLVRSESEMNNVQIFTPILPYVGRLPAELRYGSRIKLRGHFREPQSTVHIILQREALLNPHEDVPLYITVHPGRKAIVRNHLCTSCTPNNSPEERVDNCPIECGQDFELTIVPTAKGYEIVIHGTPFHTFGYRTPLAAARYLFVSSGCIIFAITYENWNVTIGGQPAQPQQPTAPPLQLPELYPTLQHQQSQQQTQQPRHTAQHQQQEVVQQHQYNNIREVILQVLPLIQLAASQLQANNNNTGVAAGNALSIETLSQLLPLFQSAVTNRRLPAKARRAHRWAFWRSCSRVRESEVLPAAFVACTIGIMRLIRFLVVAGIFGYIGYVFSRNT